MAINKEKNTNLQITISKADFERLEKVNDLLNTLLGVDLTKSQTIAFLIRNYGKSPLNNGVDIIGNREPKQATKPQTNINYQAQLKALKDKTGASFTELEKMTGISASTLKKYASGIQQPKAENEQLLINAFKNYGIK